MLNSNDVIENNILRGISYRTINTIRPNPTIAYILYLLLFERMIYFPKTITSTQCGFYYYDQKGVISGQYGNLAKNWQKLAISIKVDLKVPLKKKSVCLIFDLFLEK